MRSSRFTHTLTQRRAIKPVDAKRLLSLAAHVPRRRQHTRMPLLILSVGVTEPPVARWAVYGRRVVANRITRRDALTCTLQVLAFALYHGHPPRAVFYAT